MVEDRIAIIELILQSLKAELPKVAAPSPQSIEAAQRPAFGCMQGTGKILGDIVSPVLPEDTWEVLQSSFNL